MRFSRTLILFRYLLCFLVLAAASPRARRAGAQRQSDGPVLQRRHVLPTVSVKSLTGAGHLRVVGWDKDSIVIRGRVSPGTELLFPGDSENVKIDAHTERANDTPSADLVVYMPRRGKVAIKSVTADISASDVSGWFYSTSGSIRLSGMATSIEVESMNGSMDLDVTTPWIRARTGDGHLLLRGAPEDADVATIGGPLDIAARGMLRGQFGSVSGDIRYAGAPARGAIFDFSNHSGAVELLLPASASAAVMLSSVAGVIENGFAQIRPTSTSPHAVRLNLGRGEAQVTVRSFKGVIRLRPQ